MQSKSSDSQGNRWQYLALACVFAVVMASQVSLTLDVIRYLRGQYPGRPIALGDPWPSIVRLIRAAQNAGLRVGDRVVSIEGGRMPSGRVDVQQPLRSKSPGQTLGVTVDRGGQIVTYQAPLYAYLPENGVADFITLVAMPWFCIALGFWVTAVRPRDPRAWLMLGILLGITQLEMVQALDPLGWPSAIGVTSLVFRHLAQSGWAICMMLFGLFFPQRGRIDIRVPWMKWVLLVPLLFIALWDATRDVGLALAYPSAIPPDPVPVWLQTAILFTTISIFFASLSEQFSNPALARDERRRLKLLYWGCTVAMTPGLLRFVFAWIVYHRNPSGGAARVWADMAVPLFPITMAYVIVVQRAMDVRMVVRQGVQYAFARQGVVVMQLLVMAVIAGTALNYAESHRLNHFEQALLVGGGVMAIVQVRAQSDRVRRWVDRRFFREAYNADRILSDLGEQVRSIFDRETLIETVARKISESLHVEQIAVLLRDGAMFRPALATGYAVPVDAIPSESPMVARIAESHEPLAVKADEAWEGPPRTELVLPLASRKELLGFISLGPKKSEEPYSPSDANLLRTVAAQTGLALENSRLSEAFANEVAQRELLNREIEIAREVQQRLFPQNFPEVATLEYAGHCRPARGVGGDYYDFLSLSSGRFGLAIGDVSGKGVPAALLMASLQASVRGQSQGVEGHVAELMNNVNKLVCEASPENRYATFFYGQFDPATRKLVYSNGGHNPPIVLRGAELLRLEAGGPPVGLFRLSRYVQEEVDLQPGDVLVFFTDGISEAENPAEEEWGEDALVATVRGCLNSPPSEVISRVMEAADTFASGAPQHDDMTVVIARVLRTAIS